MIVVVKSLPLIVKSWIDVFVPVTIFSDDNSCLKPRHSTSSAIPIDVALNSISAPHI